MTKFDNFLKEDDVKEEESQWSQLPAHVLWMIKDLLHVADNVRLAFVCKNWESMSLRYLSDPMGQQYCIGPWMMHQKRNPTACWDFVNVKTMESFTLKPPDHDHITVLFSRRGWLLYQVHHDKCSIVLYNIHTNAKIIMPEAPARYTANGFIGSFSTLVDDDDGRPHCVILVPKMLTLAGELFIASVGDKKWTLHFNKDDGTRGILPTSLVVHRQKLYLFYKMKGGTISFDMTTLLRKKLDKNYSLNPNIRCWLMESDGELVKIDLHMDSNKFSLFKLNDSQTGWEELIQNDQDNRSWVLYNQHQSHCTTHVFSIKANDGGKKLYQLTSHYYNDVRPIMHIHDLISGSVQEYKPDQDGIWLDLGCINKVPPSCISVSVIDRRIDEV